MAKKLLVMLLCLVMVVGIIGCGPDDGGQGNVEIDKTTWGDMTIRVAGYRAFNDDPLNHEFTDGADKFTEEYGTQVTFQVGGGDGASEDLVASVLSGDPWELQYAFGISVFPMAMAQNLYEPITQYIDFETNNRIDKLTVDGSKWKGEYYGVSNAKMQEFYYLAYNETWMKELGLKTPYDLYLEGNWDFDHYMQLIKDAKALGAPSASVYTRDHVIGRYMSSWSDDGQVTVTYDSEDSIKWLQNWATIIADPAYEALCAGFYTSKRECIMVDDVFPNMIKGEVDQGSTDVIRYIHLPNAEGTESTYFVDSHFTVPLGVAAEVVPCAVELASYMCESRGNLTYADVYQANMNEEDFEILNKAVAGGFFLPRWFYLGQTSLRQTFVEDVQSGKAVTTHVQENIEMLKAQAEEFNAEYAA